MTLVANSSATSSAPGSLRAIAGWWRRRGKAARRAEARTGYLFIIPLFVLLGAFVFGPAIFSFYISFFHWDPFDHRVYYVGLANYQYALINAPPPNPSFVFSILNVLFYTVIVVGFQTFIAFGMALLFNVRRAYSRVTRAIVYIPAATSSVAMSTLFIWVFSYQGPMNAFLAVFGMQPLNWFYDARVAFYGIMITNIFSTAPYFMIVFLAGLQAIPGSILEASQIDGVRSLWHRFRYLYFPLLRFSTVLVVILGLIGCLQLFDQVWFITQGGPAGATYVPVIYIFNTAFVNFGTQGVGAAASFILFIVIMALTVTQRRFFSDIRWAG